MRRFLAGAWFPFLICLVLAGTTAGAFALLAPTGENVGNSEIVKWVGLGAWATGPIAGTLSFLAIGILNLVRRIVRLRRVNFLHSVVILLGIGFWVAAAWILAGEAPFTPIARAIVPYVARPLLWGSLAATLLTIVLSIPLLFPKKK